MNNSLVLHNITRTYGKGETALHVLDNAKDLEQLLCHTMDWMLRQLGYANIAVWLAGDDDEFQLGAYMKYTIPGEQALTDALRRGTVSLALKENLVHLNGDSMKKKLTPAEMQFLEGQDLIAINCTYLAESLAVVVLFRDGKTPFKDEDTAMLKSICPLFALALAGIVRETDGEDGASMFGDGSESEGDATPDANPGNLLDDHHTDQPKQKRKPKKDDADWWKRGEQPPF